MNDVKNRPWKVMSLAGLMAVCLVCGIASAQEENAGEVVEAMDTIEEATASPTMTQTQQQIRKQERIQSFDADRDGVLNDEERQAARESRERMKADRADGDGNGQRSRQRIEDPQKGQGGRGKSSSNGGGSRGRQRGNGGSGGQRGR